MKTGIITRLRNVFQRSGAIIAAGAVSLAVCVSTATPAQGNGPDPITRLLAHEQIEQLAYCYASGTDAIGRGDLALGKNIYKDCFTPNAVIEASFANLDPNAPPDFSATGPDTWAEVVNARFTSVGYFATQHLISNVQIDLQGNTATMSSYLAATHVIDPSTSIDLANGTYVDHVVRTPKGWRIAKRTLRLISFVRLEAPATP